MGFRVLGFRSSRWCSYASDGPATTLAHTESPPQTLNRKPSDGNELARRGYDFRVEAAKGSWDVVTWVMSKVTVLKATYNPNYVQHLQCCVLSPMILQVMKDLDLRHDKFSFWPARIAKAGEAGCRDMSPGGHEPLGALHGSRAAVERKVCDTAYKIYIYIYSIVHITSYSIIQ